MFAPTHKGHNLDRVYTSEPIYDNIKVVKSTVVSEHRAVVARADNSRIVDHNKTSRTVATRRRTPGQHAALLQYLQQYSWQSVNSTDDVQTAADNFYSSMNHLLDTFYPTSRITITSRDPSFVTPEIKQLLRQKNALMRKGRLDEANSIATKIGRAIIAHNSICFKDLNSRSDTKELWEKVRNVTGKNKKTMDNNNCAPNISADNLNLHYATQ